MCKVIEKHEPIWGIDLDYKNDGNQDNFKIEQSRDATLSETENYRNIQQWLVKLQSKDNGIM